MTPNASIQHPGASAPRTRERVLHVLSALDVYLILAALLVVACWLSPSFLTLSNIGNVLTQAAVLGILATGQFLVVLIGGFDLSVAAVMALSSVLIAKHADTHLALAITEGLLAALACGIASGVAVVVGRVQPLITTLAMMGVARGLAFSVSEKSLLVSNPWITGLSGASGVLTPPTLIWLALVIVLSLWLGLTRAGLHCYAIGGNETTSRLAGVRADRIKIGVYAVSGLIAGIAGLALVIRSDSGVPNVGAGWELDSIAAIVIGGARLFGGEGSLPKAMTGVLIYQLIANVMNLTGIDPYYQSIVRALVIVVAVGLSVFRQRKRDHV
ncbi:ABC transporter permease [Pararobbsia silviterrae]|nr:ABC transporter permease [Pararobbsia silviterrae]